MGKALSTMAMYEFFNLSKTAKAEMKKVDTYQMNIFSIRDETNNNELASLLMIILSKRGILSDVQELDVESLVRFILLIQRGYKDISYHNKTHASDVCQTFNYFCIGGDLMELC